MIDACRNGYTEIVEELIYKGVDINHQDQVSKLLCIHNKSKRLSIRCVVYKNENFYLFIPIQSGFTPLHYASKNGHVDIANLLFDNNVKCDIPAKVCQLLKVVQSRCISNHCHSIGR